MKFNLNVNKMNQILCKKIYKKWKNNYKNKKAKLKILIRNWKKKKLIYN